MPNWSTKRPVGNARWRPLEIRQGSSQDGGRTVQVMADEHEELDHSRKAQHEHAQAQNEAAQPTNAPDALPAYPGTLLGDSHLAGRGNRPVQIAVMRQMQQSYGNRAVQRFFDNGRGTPGATLPGAPPALTPAGAIESP